ncbi:MAG: response regulator [Candidatus Rokubacteria bacterium]|nr:response regulator [Candidatus Rokubacteria bacterium]
MAVKKWIRNGKLVGLRTPGGHFRIPAEQLDRFDAPPAEPPRVLVIDDDEAVVSLVVDGFRQFWPQAKVETATDGYEGLIQLGAFRPHVAIIDLRMPALDGFEVCRRVKANPATRGTRIIAISAYLAPAASRRALDAGADRFVPKPFAIRALVAHAGTLLGGGPTWDA